MILFVNACIGSQSRTEQIARAYLGNYTNYTELILDNTYLEPLNTATLQNRTQFAANGNFTHSYFDLARQFAEADEIIIAAPLWDLSFPAKLQVYLENICIPGLTFRYSEDRTPISLCKAKRLTCISTSGGPFQPEFSYDYIRTLAESFWGIHETQLIYAENLDIPGNNPQEIVSECIQCHCILDDAV